MKESKTFEPGPDSYKQSAHKETPEEYIATCHKFRLENIKYYTENNFFRGKVLPIDQAENPENASAQETLVEVFDYYQSQGDDYNILRWHEKMGHKEESYQLAEKIWTGENLIAKAHTAREMWQHYKDENWKQKAIEAFLQLIEQYKTENNNLMVAVNFDILYRLTKDDQFKAETLRYHQTAAANREEKGDSWWTAISLREVAKISQEEHDANVAFELANHEIARAEAAGDYKNAGLWARDLAHLNGIPENIERAQSLFLKQIEISEQQGDLRAVGKSYWEMWKVTKLEEHRLKALEYYKKLLREAKEINNQERIEECYRVLLYITK
jgi:hypothetical protein